MKPIILELFSSRKAPLGFGCIVINSYPIQDCKEKTLLQKLHFVAVPLQKNIIQNHYMKKKICRYVEK